jgi:hypothetical protein
MSKQIEQIKDVAAGIVKGILASDGKPDVDFKRVISLEPGEHQELLVVGRAHREFNDGYCIAVLNPNEALIERLNPAGYTCAILKELVAGHCDAMVKVMCTGDRASLATSYTARKK